MSPFKQLERLRFFAGQLLTADDFRHEQEYVIDRLRRRNRWLHGWGVATGLRVSVNDGLEPTVVVDPGLAIDCCGNEIVVDTAICISLDNVVGRQYVDLSYAEINLDEVVTASNEQQFLRVRESAQVTLTNVNPSNAHRGKGPGTPGCGVPHGICIAIVTKRGAKWSIQQSRRHSP